jgi:hypothetical protein
MGIVFFIFSLLAFMVLRLTVRWPWRRVALVSVLCGLVLDALLDLFVARFR